MDDPPTQESPAPPSASPAPPTDKPPLLDYPSAPPAGDTGTESWREVFRALIIVFGFLGAGFVIIFGFCGVLGRGC